MHERTNRCTETCVNEQGLSLSHDASYLSVSSCSHEERTPPPNLTLHSFSTCLPLSCASCSSLLFCKPNWFSLAATNGSLSVLYDLGALRFVESFIWFAIPSVEGLLLCFWMSGRVLEWFISSAFCKCNHVYDLDIVVNYVTMHTQYVSNNDSITTYKWDVKVYVSFSCPCSIIQMVNELCRQFGSMSFTSQERFFRLWPILFFSTLSTPTLWITRSGTCSIQFQRPQGR